MKKKNKIKDGLDKDFSDPYEYGFTYKEIMLAREQDRKSYFVKTKKKYA